MRVVHVAESIAGGIATYFEEIVGYQNEEFGSENVFFVVPRGSEVHLPSIDAAQLITFPGGRRDPLGLLVFGLTAVNAIRRLNPAIVHLHSSFAGGFVRPCLVIKRRRPGIVYCPHGWAFGMETSNLKRFAYAEYERFLAKRTDMIIVVSDTERRLGAHYGIPPHKMKTVKNGISTTAKCYGGRTGQDIGPINVAFVGRYDRQKGLDILLDALESVRPEHLRVHLVGKGVLEAKQAPQHHRENVIPYGWLSRADIVALLRQMDVVIMPSRWEGFGLVAIEAMRCGVPVIASDRGALPEIIRDGIEGFLVDIDDPGALGRVLGALDRSVLRRMGEAARARFEAEFTSHRMNVQIQSVYEAVLGAARGQPLPSIAGGAARVQSGELGAMPQKPT